MPRNYFPRRDRGGAAASRRRGETAEDLTKVGLATWIVHTETAPRRRG